MPFDASGAAGTGVVVNGRELHPVDIQGLQQLLGAVIPGRYWMDAYGTFGYEGGPAMGHVIYMAQQRGVGSGYNRSTFSGHLGSDGQTSYFFDPDTGCSVISGGGVSC